MKFIVTRTYSEVTPESAEHGDFSDTGFVFEDEVYTLRELKEYIKREGFYREGKGTNWFTNGFDTICYSSGTEREDNLHIKLIAETANTNQRTTIMTTYQLHNDYIYLDDTEFYEPLKEFMQNLIPDFQEGSEYPVEDLECRSRDGFIPHSHNKGGFDKEWVTDMMCLWGSGYDCGSVTNTQAHEAYESAYKIVIENYQEQLKDIPENKRDYQDLVDMDKYDLAEQIDSDAYEYIGDDRIYYGYRVMYEGKRGAWHTLVFYCGTNRSEYYPANGSGSTTELEIEVKFRNLKELEAKLKKIEPELVNAF